MSLKGHLGDPNSPVRQHLEANYPHVDRLRFGVAQRTDETIVIDGVTVPLETAAMFTPGEARIPPPGDDEWYPAGTAGTAFDYRIRYLFEAAEPASFVAEQGARLYSVRSRGDRRRALPVAWAELAAALPRAARPAAPGTAEEHLLGKLCCVLAFYEQLYRMGPNSPGWEHSPVVESGPKADLATLLSCVNHRLPTDVSAMTDLFAGTQPELLRANHVVANPQFALSHDLGGADADLILDGLLLELKTTKRAGLLRRDWWQVLGYVLADTEDHHQIASVGIQYARHGYLWSFPLESFLQRLAGHDVEPVDARRRFAEVARSRF